MNNQWLKPYKHKLVGFSLFFCFLGNGFAQTNLVQNYSFEQYIICPTFLSNESFPPPWYIPTNYIGGYLNTCDSSSVFGVPYNLVQGGQGYQYARTGGAYIFLNYWNTLGRTYAQIKMFDSLISGHKYYAGHFVNVPNPFKYASNNIGMLFTKTPVYVDTLAYQYGVLSALPQVIGYNNPIVKDTLNWIKIAGIFKANGGESYLTLGNFFDDKHTVHEIFQPTGYSGAGYNIDDVSVYDLATYHLQADAGPDTTITLGDSAFIGSYVNGIDTLVWKNGSGTTIDTLRPGFWVSPTTSTYYILTQTVNGYTSSDTVYVNVILPLPVTFTSYTLTPSGNTVINNWQTGKEVEISHFQVQRSEDGYSFSTIATVAAKGSSGYSFTDLRVGEGKSFYRVVGVDKEGEKVYSKTLKADIPIDKHISSIIPNPAKNNISIVGNSLKQIEIYDIVGQKVLEKQSSNQTNLSVDIANLDKGVYMVRITKTDYSVEIKKFLKH